MKQGSLDEIKALHDLVLATKPELEHAPCALCDKEPDDMTTTLTEEEHAAAIAAAVEAAKAEIEAPLTAQIEDLKAQLTAAREAQAGSELEQAVATATAELQATIDSHKTELETAQAELAAVTAERDQLVAAEEAREAEAVKAQRIEERSTAVKDLKVFPDKFVDEQVDGWADLDDEAWDAELTKFTAMKEAAGAPAGDTLPGRRSALTAVAAGGGTPSTENASSRLIRRSRDLMSATPGN